MFSDRSLALVAALLVGVPLATPLSAQECLAQQTISVSSAVGGSVQVPPNSSGTVTYTVTNTTQPSPGCWYSVSTSVSATGPVTIDSWSPTSFTLWYGESATVEVIFSTGSPGSGEITLSAAPDITDPPTGMATIQIDVNYPPPPPVGPPVISLADYHADYRDLSKCVAACFDAVAAYSTSPYYSTDMPRTIQLLYRSSHARPMGFLNIGARDTTAGYPTKMSVRLRNAQGVYVSFTNGSTEFFFACPSVGGNYVCDSTSNRLPVQFDASGILPIGFEATDIPVGAFDYTLIVRSYRPDNTFAESSVPVRVLVAPQNGATFGVGWTIAGYQRLYRVGNDIMITGGDGSVSFFKRPDCGLCFGNVTYISSAGDFSTLIYRSGFQDYKRRYPDSTVVGFSSQGHMVNVDDAFGRRTRYAYNTDGWWRLIAIHDPTEKQFSFGYVNGKLRWIRDPGGRTDSITIDAAGNLTRIKDAAGGLPFQGTYDGMHRLIRTIDRRGSARGIAYDFASKLKADTTPPVTTVQGSGQRLVVRYTSLESAALSDTALHLGTSANPAPPANAKTVRAKVTSPRGITTSFALNRFGQATRVEQPLGRTARFSFDTLGRPTTDSLPPGHLIRYTWSGTNVTQWRDSTTGRTINYAYDPTYNLLTTMSGDVDSLINALNSNKRTTDSSRVGGATRWTNYFCNASSQFDYSYCVISSGASGRLQARVNYYGTSGFKNTDSVVTRGEDGDAFNLSNWVWARTRYLYDGHGQRIRTINDVGDTTWTQYDSLGRVTRTVGPLRDTTSYTYDSLFLTQVRDARGQIYKTWPNALGWADSTADPAGRVSRITYDSGGNPVTVVNRRGQTIQFTYDSLDQLRTRVVGTDTTRFFIDPLGRYAAVSNRESVDTLKMDAAGRPTVEISCRVLTTGSASQCFRDSSVYDIRDLRTKLVATAPGLLEGGAPWPTHTASYHYDNHMLLDTLTNFSGEKQALTYGGELQDSTRKFLALNNLTATYGRYHFSPFIPHSATLSFSDAALTQQLGVAYSFDTLSRVTKYNHGTLARPDTIRSFGYTAGRLGAVADTAHWWWADGCSLWMLGERCDQAQVQSKTAVGMPTTFHYDSVGNRKDAPSQVYGSDPGNRLRRLGLVRLDYDLDGNVVRKRVLKASDTTQALRMDSLFWNAVGQLDSLRSRDSMGTLTLRITWGYDGLGRQVRQSVGSDTTRYLWDGDTRIFKLNSLGSRLAYWTYYPGTHEPQSVAFLNCDVSQGGCFFHTLYYVTDALHNTVALLKSDGSSPVVYSQFRYGPFGDSLGVTGNDVNAGHLRYKGAFYDGHTGLYQMGIRYYDPEVGRFLSEDPLGLSAGINVYTFADNDPVNGYDPTGTCAECVAIVFHLGMALFISEAATLAFQQDPCDHPPVPGPPIVASFQQTPDCNKGGGALPLIGAALSALAAIKEALGRAQAAVHRNTSFEYCTFLQCPVANSMSQLSPEQRRCLNNLMFLPVNVALDATFVRGLIGLGKGAIKVSKFAYSYVRGGVLVGVPLGVVESGGAANSWGDLGMTVGKSLVPFWSTGENLQAIEDCPGLRR